MSLFQHADYFWEQTDCVAGLSNYRMASRQDLLGCLESPFVINPFTSYKRKSRTLAKKSSTGGFPFKTRRFRKSNANTSVEIQF